MMPRETFASRHLHVEQTAEESEKDRRKAKKAERHRQLKADAQGALEAEGIPAKFIERLNTPSSGHHVNCQCMCCQIKRGK
jgi:hypothetical protein